MTVRELLTKVRDKLQDTDSVYWSDSELIDLHNECKRHLAAERKEKNTTTEVILSEGTNSYSVDGVLRYISVKDSNSKVRKLYPDDGSGDDDTSGIIVEDFDSIYVNNPEDRVTLNVKHIAMPEEDNLNDVVRSGDENAYKYYIIGKAYEKDTEMQNFQKGVQFMNMFVQSIKYIKKNSALNYIDKQETTKGYYY